MTIHGKIDMALPQRGAFGTGACAKYSFTALYKALLYFAAQGVCTQVARYNGSTGGAGTDWPNGANPFGRNAWCLFKFPATVNRTWDWYLHAHWSDYGNWGATDHGALIGANSYGSYESFGVQCARGIGSNNTIWNGTSNADGADTKGSNPYWKVPSGGTRVAVLPRSNGVGGTHAATKQNFASIVGTDSDILQRMHVVTDGDAVAILRTQGANAYNLAYLGLLDTDADVTALGGALGMFCGHSCTIPLNPASQYADTSGSGTINGGVDVVTELTHTIDRSYLATSYGATYYPNKLWTPNRYDIFRIPVYIYETPYQSYVGTLRPGVVGESRNLASHVVNGDLTRAFFGDGGTSNPVIAMAWDGATVPGFTAVPDGVEFAR